MRQPTMLAPDGPARPDYMGCRVRRDGNYKTMQEEYSTHVQGGAIPSAEAGGLRAEDLGQKCVSRWIALRTASLPVHATRLRHQSGVARVRHPRGR